ncbi:MAG TPA: MDR family MFS transporter [Xanthobacteraceae bacterium]|nr:MDR family MFS transporter [Xanthobacteraceae bacterium]
MNPPPAPTAEHPPLAHAEIRAIVLGILLAMFLGALDQTIIATALPTIGRAFADVENLSWVVTAYLLTATAATPLYGKLSDIHGRRAMLLVAISIFAAASVGCALAPSMTALALARALQGVGGGGLLSLAQTIVADVVSPLERGRYQAYIGMVFAASSIGGPVLGGFFAEHLHWSLIFWINLPIGLVAFLMTNRVLKRLPRHERPHRLDLAGAGLMMAATVVLLLALTWGGTRYPWSSAQILALLAASGSLWTLFVIRLMTAREPFLPLSVLTNPVVGMGTASVSCVFGTMIGLAIFVPLYFEIVLGLSASASGLALIPLMGGTVIGSTAAGRYMSRLPHYKRVPFVGLALAIAALALLAAEPAGLPLAVVCTALGLVGTGMGALFPVTTVSVQNAVLPYQLGTATGAMNFFRQLSGALIVAAFGAIVLGGAGGAGHAGVTLETLALQTDQFAGGDFAQVFRWVFIAAAALLAAGLLLLFAMEERPLRGRRESEVVPAE